jgi:hypothetical protein
MNTGPIRSLFSPAAAIFYCLTASCVDGRLGGLSGATGVAVLIAMFLLPSAMARWVLADARQHSRELPYDFGTFVFFAWPVVVPGYLFCTRGWRAFATIGLFLLLWIAAVLVSALPLLLRAQHGAA